jgi:signal transduction histidine kinase
LVQVVTNLLTNAAKFTPEGGDIVLSMEVDCSHIKIAVSDNGVGMTPEFQARAFELFAQAARTSDRSQLDFIHLQGRSFIKRKPG